MGITGTAASAPQALPVQTVGSVSINPASHSSLIPVRVGPGRGTAAVHPNGRSSRPIILCIGLQARPSHFGVTPPGLAAVPGGNRLSRPTANQPCSLTLITQIVFPLKGFQMATFFPIANPLFC